MSSALSPGTKLGRYEIRSQLGVGGMGEVYLAEDEKLERKVALKILPAEVASQRDRMEGFVREAKSAAALSHPNIAQIFEIGEHGDTHFITMELVILGTAGYMSPEQAQGKTKEIDHRSDIFSFGCILFEAITRHKAFAGSDTIDTLNKIIREPVAPISNYNLTAPADLQRIVRRCLAKDPDERYQTIKDVAIELKEVRRDMAGNADIGSADIDITVPPPAGSEAVRESIHQSATTSAPPESLSTRASSAEYVALDGSTPKQITDFKSDLIYNFAYSRDGRQLALARGSHTRDAVLLSEVK